MFICKIYEYRIIVSVLITADFYPTRRCVRFCPKQYSFLFLLFETNSEIQHSIVLCLYITRELFFQK